MKADFEVYKGDGSEAKPNLMISLPIEEYEKLAAEAKKWRKLVEFEASNDASDLHRRFTFLKEGWG